MTGCCWREVDLGFRLPGKSRLKTWLQSRKMGEDMGKVGLRRSQPQFGDSKSMGPFQRPSFTLLGS